MGGGAPTRIVADLASAHNGSLDRALSLLDQVAAAGADFVKFRMFDPGALAELRRDVHTLNVEFQETADGLRMERTKPTWLRRLVRKCEGVGLPWMASVYDRHIFTTLESFGCPAYRLAAVDYGRVDDLRARILDAGKPCLQSSPLFTAPDDGTYPVFSQTARVHRSVPRERFTSGGYRGVSYQGTDETLARRLVGDAELVEVRVQDASSRSVRDPDISFDLGRLPTLRNGAGGR